MAIPTLYQVLPSGHFSHSMLHLCVHHGSVIVICSENSYSLGCICVMVPTLHQVLPGDPFSYSMLLLYSQQNSLNVIALKPSVPIEWLQGMDSGLW